MAVPEYAEDFVDKAQQDDDPIEGLVTALRPNSIDKALEYARSQWKNSTAGWEGHCQKFVRSCYGVPAWAASAKLAWDKIPAEHKFTVPFEEIPRGAAIYFTMGEYGHVMIAGYQDAFSNDYKRHDRIDPVPRDIPLWHGKRSYVGYSFWTPFGIVK
jgi:hypothetical protein